MKILQIKASLLARATLRKTIAALALAGGLALAAFGTVDSAVAQPGPLCTRFAEGTAGLDGWGACSAAPNIVVTTSNVGSIAGSGDYHLHLRDTAGASAACSTDQKYLGDWVAKMGGCGQFCFDFKVFVSGIPPGPVTPSFTIWGPSGSRATFVANFTVTASDPWRQNICAPIALGATPPPSPQGHWVVTGGSWNSIITGVTMMQLPVDFTSNPSEEVGYDNMCMGPGGCGEPPKPEVTGCLKDMKVEVKCNPDGTYTVTLSGSGFTGTDITLTSQTAGVTVSPPQQPWSASTTWTITGATAGQTVTLTANETKVGGGGVEGTDQCCSGEIKIVMPECPKPQVGQVIVEKKVKNDTSASVGVINSLVFPIGLSCGAPSNLNVSFGLNNAGSHSENNVAYGSLCTVTESTSTLPPVPKEACGQGTTAVWLTPVVTPASATISAPVTVFTVLNELQCRKIEVGSLVVTKKVVNHSPMPIPTGQTYPVTVTCGSSVTNLSLVDGVPQTVSNIPLGTNCSVVEGSVTFPPNVCPPQLTPAWTTSYLPPSPVTVTGSATAVTITNIVDCERGGHLLVQKIIQNNTSANLTGMTFPATATCNGFNTPLSLTLPGPQIVHNVPIGYVCTVVETLPAAPTTGCPAGSAPTWVASPVYAPPSVTMIAGAGPTLMVRNTLNCVPVVLACPPPMVPGAVAGQCMCPPGTVQAGKECIKPPTCVPPKVPGPVAGQCICPPGSVQKGRECVKQPACLAPMVPGPVPGVCVCPQGMAQQGRRCVPRAECRPPMIPNAAGTACVCPAGTVQRGRLCEQPKVCNPPSRLNRRGQCECPRDMVARGTSCIERERWQPPGVIRGNPGGGRDNPGGPRGQGQGEPPVRR